MSFVLPPAMGMGLIQEYLLKPHGDPPVVDMEAKALPGMGGYKATVPDPYKMEGKRPAAPKNRFRTFTRCTSQTPTSVRVRLRPGVKPSHSGSEKIRRLLGLLSRVAPESHRVARISTPKAVTKLESEHGISEHTISRAESAGLVEIFEVSQEREGFTWDRGALKKKLVIVSSSGGIDSSALLLLARKKYPQAMLLIERADTGAEPPDTLETMRAVARYVRAPIINLLPPANLFEIIRAKGAIPNQLYFEGCTHQLKGDQLDKLNCWLVRNRRKETTIHLSGLLYEEPERVYVHEMAQEARFGQMMAEESLLYDRKITKARAVDLLGVAGIPLSSTYLDRTRHGCIPCKWWGKKEWQRFFQVDPAGFMAAAKLEKDLARVGKGKGGRQHEKGTIFPQVMRVWLLGDRDLNPDGRMLSQWLKIWDRKDPGWRKRPVPAGIVRPEDIACEIPPTLVQVGSRLLPVMGDMPVEVGGKGVGKRLEAKQKLKGKMKRKGAVPAEHHRRVAERRRKGGRRNTPFPLPPQLGLSGITVGPWRAVPVTEQKEDRWGPTTKLWTVQGPQRGFTLWRFWPKSWGFNPGGSYTVRLKKGTKWIGHVQAEEVRQGNEDAYVVSKSHLDAAYRGTGLGSLMYLAARNMIEAYRFKRVTMISTEDYGGSGTSPMAQKVWERLRKEGRLNQNKRFFKVTSPQQGLKVIRDPDITENWEKSLRWKPTEKTAVLLPCAATKPFPEAPSHKAGYLKAIGNKKVDMFVVSEPLGIIPYSWSRRWPNDSYDFPPEHLKGPAFDLLAQRMGEWFDKVGKKYERIYLALPAHHSRLIQAAMKGRNAPVVDVGIGACLDAGQCAAGEYRSTTHAYRDYLRGRVRGRA